MLLDLSELLSGKTTVKTFDTAIEMNELESSLGNYLITKKDFPKLTVASTGSKKYLVTGSGCVTLAIPCGRCLEDVEYEIAIEIERDLDFNLPEGSDERIEEMNYINGYHLDVDQLVYSEILLNLPFRVLCKEECKGLCFVCGHNLNKGECGCNREQLDPRMSVIQDIFKSFKEV